ncbi:hypothetical protein AYI70_g10668 [Smittium culicis]|uniref:Uncharacterized protein n=1 Tax=Smittium culicis TaxID=133412 RepID=A0A1R1X5J6_9FUNG|nr:hypothetical protein AYI70_g10668 [Smittium culicis]
MVSASKTTAILDPKPIRNSSISRAAWRPSFIPHTTRLCPRLQSPAAYTFSTFVFSSNIPFSGPKNPIASSTMSALNVFTESSTSFNFHAPFSSLFHSTLTVSIPST